MTRPWWHTESCRCLLCSGDTQRRDDAAPNVGSDRADDLPRIDRSDRSGWAGEPAPTERGTT